MKTYNLSIRLAITFIFLLVFSSFFGQNQTRDVLYLKNGSIIKGSIVEMNPSTGIKIKTADGSLFVYKMNEILKTEKEEINSNVVNEQSKSSVSNSDLEKVFKNYISQNRPELKYIDVTKVNGIKREVYGQEVYEIEYSLIIETTDNIYVNQGNSALLSVSTSAGNFKSDFSYSLKQVGGSVSAFGGNLTLIEKGKRILFEGSIPFESTDNGWRAKNFSNKNYKLVSKDYITPEMAKEQAKETAQNVALLKEKLDWQKPDISPIKFSGKYFRVENVPIFSSNHVRLFVIPIKDFYKGRNDVTKRVVEQIHKTISLSNRYYDASLNSYKQANNSSKITLGLIKADFVFSKTGYQCNIVIRATLKGDFTDPYQYDFEYKLDPIVALSSSFKNNMSKEQALESALVNLKSKIEDVIFKYQPLTLNYVRTLTDKRGKPDKVIFEKPQKFVNIDKLKFLVLNPNDMSIKDNNISISKKVGDCIYKGELNENRVVCEIRGGKNKKAFLDIMDSDQDFIGISIF